MIIISSAQHCQIYHDPLFQQPDSDCEQNLIRKTQEPPFPENGPLGFSSMPTQLVADQFSSNCYGHTHETPKRRVCSFFLFFGVVCNNAKRGFEVVEKGGWGHCSQLLPQGQLQMLSEGLCSPPSRRNCQLCLKSFYDLFPAPGAIGHSYFLQGWILKWESASSSVSTITPPHLQE